MDIHKKQMLEQSTAELREILPRLWWGLYSGCMDSGFDSRQAYALVCTYILAQNPSGIRPSTEGGPESKSE